MSWKAAGLFAAALLSSASARAEKCPNMLILLDRSGSMQGYKWETAVEAIDGFTEDRQSVMRFGLFVFEAPGDHCGSGLWKVRSDFYSHDEISDALARMQPGGMTPTPAALAAAGQTSDMTDPSRRRFMILLTDGDPTCPDENNVDPNVDLAVANLEELLRDGIKTFVIGFGQDASPARLNRMAEAGGTARAAAQCSDPANPGQTLPCKYFEASDEASLSRAFDEIATIAQGELQGRRCDDSCYVIDGCPEGERCAEELHHYASGGFTLNLGHCVADPCAGRSCGSDEFCREGACVKACMSPCPEAEICTDGVCGPDPCADNGCAGCTQTCPKFLICVEGICADDPCRYADCPESAPYCYRGSCYAGAPPVVEQPLTETETPKRGCSCGGGAAGAAGLLLSLVLLRRRR